MKILITGASGLLGKSLLETVPIDYPLMLTYHRNFHPVNGIAKAHFDFGARNLFYIWNKLDIRNRSDVFDIFLSTMPDAVIHCASIGNVDWTEDHYNEVREVNIRGLDNIIDACNGFKTKLVYISSNAIFSGDNPPYYEKSPLEPVNSYGVIKKDAESLVQREANKWLIFRPFMLYGWSYPEGRTNWAKNIIQVLSVKENCKVIKLVNDTVWQPTYAPDCANVIWKLLHEEKQIYNVASSERVTLYEFGLKVCEAFNLDKKWLEPVSSDYFNSIAKRPRDTSYDLKKLDGLGITLSDIKTGLERMRNVRKS